MDERAYIGSRSSEDEAAPSSTAASFLVSLKEVSSTRSSRLAIIVVLMTVPAILPACDVFFGLDSLAGGRETDAEVDSPPGAAPMPDGAGTGDDGASDAPRTNVDATSSADSATVLSGPDASDAVGAVDVFDAATAVTCDAGTILCNGACVDPSTDPNHCNGCGNVCASGSCGSSIAADLKTKPAGWQFNGSAQYESTTRSALLVPADVRQAGTFVFVDPVVVDEFDASFDFRIGNANNTRSDGMGFMFQRTGPSAVGATGGALGMGGLDGYGVEIDVFNNGMCGDNDGNHIGVDALPSCTNNMPTPLFVTTNLTNPDLGDAAWHTLTVKLKSSAISVSLDSSVIATSVALSGFAPGTQYFLGFAAATGGLVNGTGAGGETMEVRNVAITFPTPRCL
jgi:hypothetical protein